MEKREMERFRQLIFKWNNVIGRMVGYGQGLLIPLLI